jgi:hypothetical protein
VPIDATDDVSVLPACATHLVKIGDTAKDPDEILIDGDFVYWHDAIGVARAPKAGGPAQVLAPVPQLGWPALGTFALSSTDVYFGSGPTMIAMVSKQGGPMQPVPMPIPNFPRVATSSTMVYGWAEGAPSPLFAAPLGGGPGKPIGNLPTPTSKMVIDGARGFTATDAGVQSVDLVTGAVTFLSGLGASDVAVDSTDVYFTTIDVTNGTSIMRVPKNGGPQSKVVDWNGAYGIAVGETDLYFTDRLDMLVQKLVGKTGSSIVQIAGFDPTTQPVDIALDEQCAYFTVAPSGAPGAIFAAPK